MIPKILHQIWIGPNEMPLRERVCVKLLKRYNPNYKHKMWGNKEIFELSKELPHNAKEKFDMFVEQKLWALATDIIRNKILHKYGGVYMDVDFVPSKKNSLDILPVETKDLLLVNMKTSTKENPVVRFQNCFIASKAGHPFMKRLLDRVGIQGYTLTSLRNVPCEKYNTQYMTVEYWLHYKPTYKGRLPLQILRMKPERLGRHPDAILPKEYFFGKDALVARHLFLLSHDSVHPSNNPNKNWPLSSYRKNKKILIDIIEKNG